MALRALACLLFSTCLVTAHNIPAPDIKPFAAPLKLAKGRDNLQVDLGYGVYEGYLNETSDLNIWKAYAHQPNLTAVHHSRHG